MLRTKAISQSRRTDARFVLSVAILMLATIVAPVLSTLTTSVSAAPISAKRSDVFLELKFVDTSAIELRGNSFVGEGADAVNEVLGKAKVRKNAPLFSQDNASLKQLHRELRAQNKDVADLSQYYLIELSKGQNLEAVSAGLKNLQVVEEAYPQPAAAPAPATPSWEWEGALFHRYTAPRGVDVNGVATWPGATGTKVQIVDMEYSWNVNHEDLSKARATGAFIQVGTYADPYPGDNGHGTGVLGILGADKNGLGVEGMVNGARIRMINAYNTAGYNPANVINVARNNMTAGDVLLIEQQSAQTEATSGAPLEWIPSVYDAIKTTTAANINVVEAAGNGGKNLNDTSLFGSPFPSGKSDSGAIIVGAAEACNGTSDPLLNSRMPYSTYGTRVNLFGPGECVATSGTSRPFYNNGPNENYGYFSGTSSAAAVVAGAVASYTSAYEQLNGVAPSASSVRANLVSTGTAQNFSTGTLSGNIGRMPDLKKAIVKTDLKAPTAPTALSATLNTSKKPVLKWTAATDNVAVTSYQIFRNGVRIATISPTNTYTDSAATTGSRRYYVKAVDQTGRISAASNAITVSVP